MTQTPAPTYEEMLAQARNVPVGTIQNEADHKGLFMWMSLIALEDRQFRDPFLTIADLSVAVFNWGDADWTEIGWAQPIAVDELRVNQVQNDTIAVTKTTFREPVAFEIVCSDTGSYAPCFWAGPANIPINGPAMDPMTGQQAVDLMTGQPAVQQMNLLQSWGLTSQQVGPSPEVDPLTQQPTGNTLRQQPLDPMQAMQIEQQLAAMGLPNDWIVHADKRLVSAIYQEFFDSVWNDPKFAGQQWAYRFGLDANTCGWNTAMYEWRQDVGDVIVPLSVKQVYFDQQHIFIHKMQHVMADFAFDVTWAKQQFPWIAKEIDENKQRAGGVPVSVDGNTTWGQRDHLTFQRDIVVMRIGWFRDQPVPLSVEEATRNGYVTEEPNAVQEPATAQVDVREQAGNGQAMGEGNAQGQVAQESAPQVTHRLSDGTSVTPPAKGQPLDPNWPMRICLRRVMAIGGKIVSDMPEDHWDIPIIHLVCFPVTNTPYGTGIPFKCWQIQKSRTSFVQSIKETGEYIAHPMLVGPKDVLESLGADARGVFMRPNALLKVDKTYLANTGMRIDDIVKIIMPPPLPPAVVDGEARMEEIQTKLSGNMPVLQGESPGASDSGRKIQSLQEAAINQVNTGDDTESCLQRLGMLMQHAHVKFATVDDVMKYYHRLPRGVIEAIHVDIAPTLHWEVRCSVSSGGGMLKTRQRQQAIIDNQTIDPYTKQPLLDIESTREAADIDNEEVEQRFKSQAEQMMRMMGPQQQQTAGANNGNDAGMQRRPAGRISDDGKNAYSQGQAY